MSFHRIHIQINEMNINFIAQDKKIFSEVARSFSKGENSINFQFEAVVLRAHCMLLVNTILREFEIGTL